MRAMIVGAGLGTRLLPLTRYRPKPAVPIRGLPLIAYNLELLASAGVSEVVVNLHHLPDVLREAAERSCPPGLALRFSLEAELLHTGGGIRKVSDFLRESDPCVVLGGDMIVDLDLPALLARHADAGRNVTMALLDDSRADAFGSIGLDARGRMVRISQRLQFGAAPEEARSGLYTWVNLLSPSAFDSMPDRQRFNHLDDWWARDRAAGDDRIGGEVLSAADCSWQPIGSPAEYLHANFAPLPLRYLDADARARSSGTTLEKDRIIGQGAQVGVDSKLDHVVVWDGEHVPGGLSLRDGIFAGGEFHACPGDDA